MAQSKRKFYRTTFTIEVLSDRQLGEVSLEQLAYLTDQGDCVGSALVGKEHKVSAKVMAGLLEDAGSDPGFFQLNDDGSDAD